MDENYLTPHIFTRHKLPSIQDRSYKKQLSRLITSAIPLHLRFTKNQVSNNEVPMNPKKRKPKSVWIAELHAEALRLAGNVSASQHRFFKVATTYGKELEPDGLHESDQAPRRNRPSGGFFVPRDWPASYLQHPVKVCRPKHPTKSPSPYYPSKTAGSGALQLKERPCPSPSSIAAPRSA